MSNDMVNCDYCNKEMKIKNTYAHIRNYCMKVPDNVRKRYIEKYNKRKNAKSIINISDTINTLNGHNINNTNNTNNNNSNNIDNSSNSHNTNNITNNIENLTITYNVNPLTCESIDHLKKEDFIKILNTGSNMYDKYLKLLYEPLENLNIYIEDRRKGIMGYMDEDKTISYMREEKALDMLTDKNMLDLNDLYDEYENELGECTKRRANYNLDKYFNDNVDGLVKKEYRDKTYFMILKKSNLAKKRIKDFVKLKDKDGNVMKLKDENGEEWVLINPHLTKT
jgi:hypothetical protein